MARLLCSRSTNFHARADTNEAFDFYICSSTEHAIFCLSRRAANSTYSKYSTIESNKSEHRRTPFLSVRSFVVHVLCRRVCRWICPLLHSILYLHQLRFRSRSGFDFGSVHGILFLAIVVAAIDVDVWVCDINWYTHTQPHTQTPAQYNGTKNCIGTALDTIYAQKCVYKP